MWINWNISKCVFVLTRKLFIQITSIHVHFLEITRNFILFLDTHTKHTILDKIHNFRQNTQFFRQNTQNQINNFQFQNYSEGNSRRKIAQQNKNPNKKNQNPNTASCWQVKEKAVATHNKIFVNENQSFS